MEPSQPLTEREIIAILDSYQEASISTRSSRLSRERAEALNFYNMEPYGNETKTGSKAVTSEVFDAGQWQEVQSTLLRQTLNNIYLNNHQRPIVKTSGGRPRVDMTSLLTAGPGQPIYVEDVDALSYQPPAPIAEAIMAVSENVRQQGETRTGLTRLTRTSMNPNSITKTATGAALVDQNENEREELMARVCAETCLKPVFKAISILIKKYQNKKKMIRIYKKFIEMDPTSWSEAYDMSINVGLGSGTARQTTENIERLMAVQEKIVASGGLGTIVTPMNIFNTAARHAESIGFKDASGYYTDPSTVEPKEPEPSIEDKQLAALKEIEQLKALMKQLEIETDYKKSKEKNENELMKAAMESRIRLKIAGLEADLKSEAVAADVVKADRKNRNDTDIAVMNAIRALDEEEMKEKAALQLEDKKVVSIRSAKTKTSAKKEVTRQEVKKPKKMRIKAVGDDDFEVEVVDDPRGSKSEEAKKVD